MAESLFLFHALSGALLNLALAQRAMATDNDKAFALCQVDEAMEHLRSFKEHLECKA